MKVTIYMKKGASLLLDVVSSAVNRSIAFAICLLTVVLAGSANAASDPTDAIIAAVEGVEGQATTVMAAAGAVIIALAILGGLWALGARWSRKAARGG